MNRRSSLRALILTPSGTRGRHRVPANGAEPHASITTISTSKAGTSSFAMGMLNIRGTNKRPVWTSDWWTMPGMTLLGNLTRRIPEQRIITDDFEPFCDRDTMKPLRVLSFLLVTAVGASLVGCNKQTTADATQPLKQSFQTAEPEVKQVIETVTTSLKAANYVEA